MSENVQELQQEIDRLRDLVRHIDGKDEKRSIRVEFIENGLVCTCPSVMDELEFGKYVASVLTLMLKGMAVVGEVTAVPEKA